MGFEPTAPFGAPAFETGTIDRSVNLPFFEEQEGVEPSTLYGHHLSGVDLHQLQTLLQTSAERTGFEPANPFRGFPASNGAP